MKPSDFKTICNQIFQGIFGRDCPYDLPELKEKFAFDLKLPELVKDSTTGEDTYSAVANGKTYITDRNSQKRATNKAGCCPGKKFIA